MDGKVARWRKSTSILGQELDSMADLISFGVAPAVLGFACGLQTILDIFVLTFFVCCGAARLARYNATVSSLPKNSSGMITYYEGTPIPTSLLLVCALAFGVFSGRFWGFLEDQNQPYLPVSPFKIAFEESEIWGGKFNVFQNFFIHPFVFLYALNGALMVSRRLRIPKF
ncbi:CDP-diacylglycerol-serine O-phosphatidyltransferase [Zancudomyces culisetae]|uniref:CDP-diacylglycerol-serine O-phosphatidyltransferase n=1 Tax=Zancudomyces culisetae TaxID=1213189 RepID=A0A1R1PX05_ZANCU|nr:CDP-diacylglycerol-serine O-phosphatidyltransferase [Zancudomyces culisetae]|eukprot:OMH85469.1 CDP-diacylglycerol-serine O-phosphatidyltransferase [Zancudomyces culisetae]